ncbi:hypothetical protein KY289_008163 [Solanum tuberosum]|nr:hypothetical protein KY289_008163 [Solanum tuberosum]
MGEQRVFWGCLIVSVMEKMKGGNGRSFSRKKEGRVAVGKMGNGDDFLVLFGGCCWSFGGYFLDGFGSSGLLVVVEVLLAFWLEKMGCLVGEKWVRTMDHCWLNGIGREKTGFGGSLVVFSLRMNSEEREAKKWGFWVVDSPDSGETPVTCRKKNEE